MYVSALRKLVPIHPLENDYFTDSIIQLVLSTHSHVISKVKGDEKPLEWP